MLIRSQAVLDSARGAQCSIRLPCICNGNAETTVWCHLNGYRFGKGAGVKAHDILGFHGCSSCHAYYDVGHGTRPLMSETDLLWAVLGAVTETWVRLIAWEVIKIHIDNPKPASERPVKPRKPASERATINSRNEWPKGQKIPSKPMRAKP